MLEAIEQSLPMSEQVADLIRKSILDRTLKPGQAVTIRMISKQLNVSTTPVKEAFKILSSEGLIDLNPRKETKISEMCFENIHDIALIRSSIEGAAAYFAAKNLSQEEKDRMKDILEELKRLIPIMDLEGFIQLNTEFHGIIDLASKNKYLIQQINFLRSFDITMRKSALKNKADLKESYSDHKKIYEALIEGNQELAEKLVVMHVRRASENVLDRSQ